MVKSFCVEMVVFVNIGMHGMDRTGYWDGMGAIRGANLERTFVDTFFWLHCLRYIKIGLIELLRY